MAVRHIYEDEAFLEQLAKKKATATPDAIDEDASSFIQAMLSENLNHARHVENERLTYCTAATTLFGVSTAFISNQETYTPVSLVLCLVMIGFIFLSMRINGRWSNAFQRHLEYAKGCYYILHKDIFLDEGPVKKQRTKEEIQLKDAPNLSLLHLPLYSFNIQNPKIRLGVPAYNKRMKKFQIKTIGELEDKVRTHDYFKFYYWGLFLLSWFLLIIVICDLLRGIL